MATTPPAVVIGVMGGGTADDRQAAQAFRLGQLIAAEGWVLLNGGRDAGIMAASARGAREKGGITVGILPDDHTAGLAPHILIPIVTGMGSARNYINVLSSRVVVACAGGPGTLSEVALALKHGRPVILMGMAVGGLFTEEADRGRLKTVAGPEEAVAAIKHFLETEREG